MHIQNKIIITVGIVFTIVFLAGLNIWDSIFYKKYFDVKERAIAITTESYNSGTTSMTVVYRYVYKAGGKYYEGRYSIPKDSDKKRIKCPKHKYLVIFSEKKPAYHVFVPVEVTKENFKDITIDESKVKKEFSWLNNKAKVFKK